MESFRYRAKDAWRAITRIAVHEARVREIRMEIFNNEKLKSFFSENTRDLQVLRHDKPLKTVKVQQHLAHIPEYIVPRALKRFAIDRKTSISSKANDSDKKRSKSSVSRTIYERKANNPLLCSEIDFGQNKSKFSKKSNTKKRKIKQC